MRRIRASLPEMRCRRQWLGEKGTPLQTLLLEVETLWAYLRLLHDLKGISAGEFQNLSERLADIGPQATAWMKWDRRKHASPPPKRPTAR